MEFKDKLNIWLTFDITIFTLVGSYSTYMQVVLGQEKGKVDDVRNELEKLYGPIYSVLNKVVYENAKIGVLSPNEKNMIDKKFSTYPYVNQNLYDYWDKEIRPIKKTMVNMSYLFKLSENSEIYESSEASYQNGVYRIPKEFILKFFEEYDKKVKEYRKLVIV